MMKQTRLKKNRTEIHYYSLKSSYLVFSNSDEEKGIELYTDTEAQRKAAPMEPEAERSVLPQNAEAIPSADFKHIPDFCQQTCSWKLLNVAVIGDDGVSYTPYTGVTTGNAITYQTFYSCRCR